jgi:hypothetical protein
MPRYPTQYASSLLPSSDGPLSPDDVIEREWARRHGGDSAVEAYDRHALLGYTPAERSQMAIQRAQAQQALQFQKEKRIAQQAQTTQWLQEQNLELRGRKLNLDLESKNHQLKEEIQNQDLVARIQSLVPGSKDFDLELKRLMSNPNALRAMSTTSGRELANTYLKPMIEADKKMMEGLDKKAIDLGAKNARGLNRQFEGTPFEFFDKNGDVDYSLFDSHFGEKYRNIKESQDREALKAAQRISKSVADAKVNVGKGGEMTMQVGSDLAEKTAARSATSQALTAARGRLTEIRQGLPVKEEQLLSPDVFYDANNKITKDPSQAVTAAWYKGTDTIKLPEDRRQSLIEEKKSLDETIKGLNEDLYQMRNTTDDESSKDSSTNQNQSSSQNQSQQTTQSQKPRAQAYLKPRPGGGFDYVAPSADEEDDTFMQDIGGEEE